MAAPGGNKNAAGNSGGKSLQDHQLEAKVRNLTLEKIATLLEMPVVQVKRDNYDLYKQVLVKRAGGVLHRLNEVTGEDLAA